MTAGMWRVFIHRSARQRSYSISRGWRCSVATIAVVPSYSSMRSILMRLRARKSFVIGVPIQGGFNVGPVDIAASELQVSLNRIPCVVRVPTMRPPTTYILFR